MHKVKFDDVIGTCIIVIKIVKNILDVTAHSNITNDTIKTILKIIFKIVDPKTKMRIQ